MGLLAVLIVLVGIIIFVCHISRKPAETPPQSPPTPPPSETKSISPERSLPDIRHSSVYSATEIAAQTPSHISASFKKMLKYFSTPTIPSERIITDEFLQAEKILRDGHPVVLITGGAGTGKTTLIEYLSEQGLADITVAFTGVAALNCHGKTIHSLFQLPPGLLLPEDLPGLKPLNWKSESLLKNAHTLVIDEISMVRADLLDALDFRLRTVRNEDVPFGGIQLLLVGDPFQLPPVVGNEEREYFSPYRPQCVWNSAWFFAARSLRDANIVHLELTRVFRQAPEEKEYISYLNDLRCYRNLDAAISYFNRNCFREHQDKDIVTLTADNATATARNKRELQNLPGASRIYEATSSGSFLRIVQNMLDKSDRNDPDALGDIKRLPAPYHLELKNGALIMLLVNDGNKQFVNGSTGVVQRMDDHAITVRLSNGNTVAITRHEWQSVKLEWDETTHQTRRTINGTYEQFPLMLAWAITTHKSQGRTLPQVRVEFSRNAFAPGQTYVALSRTRRVSDLYLSRPLNAGDFPEDIALNEYLSRVSTAFSN